MSKVCLITGATKGIGLATVKKLSADSYLDIKTFILVSRNESEIKEVANIDELSSKDIDVHTFACDIGDFEQVEKLCNYILDLGLNVDYLVNNAGYTKPVGIREITIPEFTYTLNVNLIGPFLLMQKLLGEKNIFEVIINIASTAGMNGRAGWLTYSASKAAVINMSEVMREELQSEGVRVVCLSPGRCATDLRRTLAPYEDQSTIMQPEDVAEIISFYLSPNGQYIDSKNIVVRT